jgi:hypothetical protein
MFFLPQGCVHLKGLLDVVLVLWVLLKQLLLPLFKRKWIVVVYSLILYLLLLLRGFNLSLNGHLLFLKDLAEYGFLLLVDQRRPGV